MTIAVKAGKELTQEEIQTINKWRKKSFGSSPIVLSPQDENWAKKYFLLYDAKKLVAFGRLHDVTITFKQKTYHILGIASIVAVEKGEGYGTKLVEAITKYIKQNEKTGIGFCAREVAAFYKKCDCGILKKTDMFLYKDPSGKLVPSKYPGDNALYVEGKDKLIQAILSNPDEPILMSRPHW